MTGVVLAGVFLIMVPWAWKRTSAQGFRRSAGLLVLWSVFVLAGQAGGWDRAEALSQFVMVGAVLGLIWMASRHPPDRRMIEAFALGVIVLAIWGLWQSLGGLHELRFLVETLPEHMRAGATARIDQGRAFASMLLPSHLAVVLAMVLPILMLRINRNIKGIAFGLAFTVGLMGIVATRSPVGILLALGACGSVLVTSRPRNFYWALALGLVAVAVVIGVRPDVLRLEPVTLRMDNWGSALWVWSTAPFSGVGLGGFGQAAQTVPWPVGNHPVHAHSLPLELLADLGAFGLGLWILAMVWLLRVARRLWSHRPDIAAALLVIPAHNLIDFSFYTTAVALPWALVLGWSLALTRSDSQADVPVSSGFRWIPVLGGALAAAGALLAVTGFILRDAARGDASLKTRIQWAGRAATLTPWDSSATELVGELALESGSPEVSREALRFLEGRQWQRPRSAARAQLMGRLSSAAGDPVNGLACLWRAQESQPYDGRRLADFEIAAEKIEGRRADR